MQNTSQIIFERESPKNAATGYKCPGQSETPHMYVHVDLGDVDISIMGNSKDSHHYDLWEEEVLCENINVKTKLIEHSSWEWYSGLFPLILTTVLRKQRLAPVVSQKRELGLRG